MKTTPEQKAERAIVKQARKIVVMRRRRALWRDLEPELNELGRLVRKIEKIEATSSTI